MKIHEDIYHENVKYSYRGIDTKILLSISYLLSISQLIFELTFEFTTLSFENYQT